MSAESKQKRVVDYSSSGRTKKEIEEMGAARMMFLALKYGADSEQVLKATEVFGEMRADAKD